MASPLEPSKLVGLLQDLLKLPAVDERQALTEAASAVAGVLSCEKVDAFFYDSSRSSLIAIGTSRTPLGERQKQLGLDVLPVANGGRIVQVFRSGRPHLDGHVERDGEELRGIVHDLGVRSQLLVPLYLDDELQGVLGACSPQPEHFSDDDVQLLQLIGQCVSSLAQRSHLVQRLRREEAEHGRRAAADEIVTVLAHDIWNHLNPLFGRLQMLRLLVLQGEVIEVAQLDAAVASVQRLSRLTQDLLDSARLEQGLFALELAPVDVSALAQEVGQLCSSGSGRVHVEAPAELVLIADANRLRQALENVVLNGVKHSRGKPVIIAMSSDAQAVTIRVSDQGSGIEPSLRERLFDRFVAAGPARGLGLGLYVARRIAEAHGGTLDVASTSSGSEFSFRLPTALPAPADLPSRP